MNTSQSHISSNEPSSSSNRIADLAWRYGTPIPGTKNKVSCNLCKKIIGGGGITRFKEHLAGLGHDVVACRKADDNVKYQMRQLLEELKREKLKKKHIVADIRNPYCTPSTFIRGTKNIDLDEQNSEEEDIHVHSCSTATQSKKRKNKGGIEKREFFSQRITQGGQIKIEYALQEEEKIERANRILAEWFYEANIPFSATNSPNFQKMIDAISNVGPGFKGPSYSELRGSLLKKSVNEMKEYLETYKATWSTRGCTVMVDSLKDQDQRTLINFLVYCPTGVMFIKSVDASNIVKSIDALYKLFDEVVQYIGPRNIVQFITDNTTNYRAAGSKLADSYGTFYWTPCASHCIELILEDLEDEDKFPIFCQTIKRARMIINFIYNSTKLLNILRQFTNGRDIIRPANTRFATIFLTMSSIIQNKVNLRKMFLSEEEWVTSTTGKNICETISDSSFWKNCEHILLLTEPLIRVLRLIDSEDKPTMGYLYEAMKKAKKSIKYRMQCKRLNFLSYLEVIEERWDNQLYNPLHIAGYFLNPNSFYSNDVSSFMELRDKIIDAITRLERDVEKQEIINNQCSDEYRHARGYLGCELAIRSLTTMNPVMWWETYGGEVPELQNFAIRILSQCCSSIHCERNLSIFEYIHSEKKNRIEHQRLNDLLFVHYNLKLRERNIQNKYSRATDPISLDNIDIISDWIVKDELDKEEIKNELHLTQLDEYETTTTTDEEEITKLNTLIQEILLQEED